MTTDTDSGPETDAGTPQIVSDPTVSDIGDYDESGPSIVELSPPAIRESRFGTLGALWSCYRYQKKRRKLAADGYVQWYLVDGTWPRPRYVKPELNGAGVPECDLGDDTYLFPTNAKLPSQAEGLWTYVHKKDEIDPINLQDPTKGAIAPDELSEVMDMKAATDPPGWLSSLNVDPKDLVMYAIGAIILYGFLSQVMSGVL